MISEKSKAELIDQVVERVRARLDGAVIAEATNLCRDYAAYSSDEAAPERYGERYPDAAASAINLAVDLRQNADLAGAKTPAGLDGL